MNNKTFSGKVALVIGGTSGIGKTTAIEFGRAGAKIVLTGRREEEGAQVVTDIKKLRREAASLPLLRRREIHDRYFASGRWRLIAQ